MAAAIAAAEERTFAAMKEFMEQSGPDARGRGPKYSGHFAGLTLIRADAQKEPERRGRLVDQQAARSHAGRPRARSWNRGAPRL